MVVAVEVARFTGRSVSSVGNKYTRSFPNEYTSSDEGQSERSSDSLTSVPADLSVKESR
jgi:hypothetical protein